MRAAILALVAPLLAIPALAQLGDLYGRAWLRVETPDAAEVRADLPLVEVGGHAGARGLRTQDLVLVLDVSDSTVEPCGLDLDGDGEDGTTDPAMSAWLHRQPDVRDSLLARVESSDFDDSVLMAELAAAEAIVAQVDARAFRVGLVAFSNHAWVVSPVGSSPAELVEGLDHLRWNFFYDLAGTDFARAVQVGAKALADAPGADEPGRERSILFLSDGAIAGGREVWEVEESVLAAAREATHHGVRIFSYALGPEAVQELDVYRGMAELTGGRFEKLDRPTDAVARLRAVDFARVAELSIENLTTGAAARALRRFQDGSFDALVELAPGPNRVRFTARASNGSAETAERLFTYEKPEIRTAEEAAQQERRLAELADRLQKRTAETRLVAEMARRRPVQSREIELRAEASRRRAAEPVPPAPVASGPEDAAPGPP
jgi:von Willebrand factor type A domain